MDYRGTAYSLLTCKSVDDKRRIVSGVASTPTVDRMGDSVNPLGAKFKTPMPLLLYHNSELPVGTVDFARPTKTGIPFEASLPLVEEAGVVQERVNEALHSLKYKLIGCVSIGFRAMEDGVKLLKETGGLIFEKWEWLELTLCSIPANPDAVIHGFKSLDMTRVHQALGTLPVNDEAARAAFISAIKSLDAKHLAASGRTVNGPSPPGVSGTKQPASGGFFYARTKGNEVKTLQQLIDERSQKAARLQELTELKTGENRRFTADEATEFDGLTDDIEGLDDDIRTAKANALSASTARAVEGLSQRSAAQSRGRSTNVFVRNADPDEKYQGQNYVRSVIAKAVAHNNMCSPIDVAQARWGKTHPQLVQWIKADVAGGGSGSGEWGAELVQADARFTGDFIEYLYSMTVFDKLPLRSVPANVTIKGQDGAATGYFVGESKAINVSKADFSTVSLTPLKVAALAVVSNELLRDSSPSAEMLVRDSLVEASAQRVDSLFLSTTAASNGVAPAGILNGLTANTSGGTTAADLRDDLAGLVGYFAAQKNTGGLALVTTPAIAIQMMLLRNALGVREFPGMTMTGGEAEGFPAYVGDNVGSGDLIMLKPSDIWKIGDGGVQVSVSREATIEMNDAPAGASDTPVDMSAKRVSMFQTESTAIKVVRSINWQKRRSTAVAYIGNAVYGDPASI